MVPGRCPALAPDLRHRRALVIGKEADTVGATGDLVEVRVELGPGEVLEHVLPHLEGRLHVEGDPGEYSERTEIDHRPGKVLVAVLQPNELSIGTHQLDRRD